MQMGNMRVVAMATLFSLLAPRSAAQLNPTVAGLAPPGFGDIDMFAPLPIPTFSPDLHPCPEECKSRHPSNWTVYSSYDRLQRCQAALVFDFNLYNSVTDAETPTKLRVCSTAGDDGSVASARRASPGGNLCPSPAGWRETQVTLEMLEFGDAGVDQSKHEASVAALGGLQTFFSQSADDCESTFMAAYQHGVVAGVYVGASFGRATVASVTKRFLASQFASAPTSSSGTVAQVCDSDRSADSIFGIVVNMAGNVTDVQNAFRTWNDGRCVSNNGASTASKLDAIPAWESAVDRVSNHTILGNHTIGNNTSLRRGLASHPGLAPRQGTCRTIQVVSGDGCGTLASRCGISGADFTKYNTQANLCSTLMPGQYVCCSPGGLPDIRPKPKPDGTCATYLVVSGDSCARLAASNGLKVEDIERFNLGTTWGWNGCNALMTDMYICLSTGKPPMPFPIPNAACGPAKAGSSPPTGNMTLSDLNPCPLNACCNVWGQCGISGDFCEVKKSSTGNPGTSGLRNGCVSSCNTFIVNTNTPPAQHNQRVGYYQSWNFKRKCLHQRVGNANTDGTYTHIHWAFAEINTADWTVQIKDPYRQWDDFKALPLKRIISFGGWGYSTEIGTYDILRQMMSSDSTRATFVNNVAAFVEREGIDGVDFDWEYPGAIDIPGTPQGKPTDGILYFFFIYAMRAKLAANKSLSIAAPASYWYLKAFYIKEMAQYLDYIVYMTYDLHGQWDVDNQWAMEGCPLGNCLRSHVNATETMLVLSMITKAGVETRKIFVGESSYGRSFKMAQAGCKGPMCTFTGTKNVSYAKPGECTDTAGYLSNAEISKIILEANSVEGYWDTTSNSDIVIYDKTEWVAYMTDENKRARRLFWQNLNFAGTIDWAVDMQSFSNDEFVDPNTMEELEDQELPPPLPECTGSYNTLEELDAAKNSLSAHCAPVYMVEVLQKTLTASLQDYDGLLNDGYDRKFDTYAEAVVRSGQKAIDDWMYKHGNDYFTCDVVEPVHCCERCHHYYTEDRACQYCQDYECGWSSACLNPKIYCEYTNMRWMNVSGPCPPDYSLRAVPTTDNTYNRHSIYWYFRDGKRDAFFAKLFEDTGISADNIKFTNYHRLPSCRDNDKECDKKEWEYNFPTTNDFNKDDVLNPKDVVKGARDKLNDVVPQLEDVVTMLRTGLWEGAEEDAGDAMALPVLMVQEAVKNMKEISDTVDKWEDEKRKNIILAFLSAIFFFVPILGQLVGTVASLANIARIIVVLGTLGEVATEIYQVVDNKDNLPLALFSVVLAPLAIMDAAQIGKAASRMRAASPNEIKALGKNINEGMQKVSGVNRVCRIPLQRREFPMGGLPMSGLNGEKMWARF